MFSPCHNTEMTDADMMICTTCGKWHKRSETNSAEADELLRMMGIDPSKPRQH